METQILGNNNTSGGTQIINNTPKTKTAIEEINHEKIKFIKNLRNQIL